MIATAQEIAQSNRRRLRMLIEVYLDVQDTRMGTEARVRQYAEHEALVAAVGELEADRLRHESVEAHEKAVKAHRQDPLFVEAYRKAEELLLDSEHHKRVNELARQQEGILKRLVMQEIKDHPVWTTWLSKVYGIGPCLGGGLLAWCDPCREGTRHVSQLWKYMGLAVVTERWKCHACENEIPHHPSLGKGDGDLAMVRCPKCQNTMAPQGRADRRTKGERTGYNPKAKVLAYKIATSFVKLSPEKSGYRRLYDEMRAKVNSTPCSKVHKDQNGKIIPCFDAHKFAKAKRLTVKIFIANYFLVARRLAGLPVSDPFIFWKGHDRASLIEPIYDVKDGAAEE